MATLLADYIQNTNTSYPSHLDVEGKGGYRVVETLAVRNAIPSGKRVIGMVVYVTADKKTYRCKSLTATDASAWEEVTYGTTVDISGCEVTSNKVTNISDSNKTSTTNYLSVSGIVNYIDSNYVSSDEYTLAIRNNAGDKTDTKLSDISNGNTILLTETSKLADIIIPTASLTTSTTIKADTLYVASSSLASLAVTKATETLKTGFMHEYKMQFTASTNFTPTFTGFGTIKWLDGETPTCAANKSYEISICNGLGICAEFS